MLQGALKAEERHNELTMEMAQKALKNAKAEVANEIENLLLPLVYLDADGKWHMVKPYANKLHLFVESFLDLYEKYTEGNSNG